MYQVIILIILDMLSEHLKVRSIESNLTIFETPLGN